MLRRLLETFTATHFTILALGATLAPSALYATVSTMAVSVTDPNSGAMSYVDAGRRVYMYDSIAGYQNYPGNYVYLHFACGANGNSVKYTPPSGKALILKAVNFFYFSGSNNQENSMFLVNDKDGERIADIESASAADSKNVELGDGYFIRDGESIVEGCSGGGGYHYATLVGYLVPSNVVPPGHPDEGGG